MNVKFQNKVFFSSSNTHRLKKKQKLFFSQIYSYQKIEPKFQIFAWKAWFLKNSNKIENNCKFPPPIIKREVVCQNIIETQLLKTEFMKSLKNGL